MKATGRERSLIALAILAGLGFLGYAYVLEPIQDWRQAGSDIIPTREAALERRRLLVAQRPVITAEIEKTNKQIDTMSARWLKGPTPPLAASELQTLIKGLADQAGAEMRSERILPLVERGGLQEVPIEITVASGLREAVRLLYDLQHTTKILTVQDVKVRVIAVGQPKDLLTTFTVSGYLLPGSVAPAAGEPAPASPKG
ncbi:MAG TPA: type II secretion system protein GspM [Candidatus Methylomirabilis sp.]|nr:type II secretion system protein GspM [Candidatus Methylomirabilis sp.]